MTRLLLLALSIIGLGQLLPQSLAGAEAQRLLMVTNHGEVTLEVWPDVAPETCANFIGLAMGTKEWTDPTTKVKVKKPFYDGRTFHRVIKGFMIQGGCPLGTGTSGPGYSFKDEIDANTLGLDKATVVQNEESLLKLITAGRGMLTPAQHQQLMQTAFHPHCGYMAPQFMQLVVSPKYQEINLTPDADQAAVLTAMRKIVNATATVTLKEFYETIGYTYTEGLPSVKPVLGSLCMANSGPNTNGSQFFINLGDTPHLTGKHTVFGKVTAGMDVVNTIGGVAVQRQNSKPLQNVTITSIRLLGNDTASAPGPAKEAVPAAP